jgi:hypothetical protein
MSHSTVMTTERAIADLVDTVTQDAFSWSDASVEIATLFPSDESFLLRPHCFGDLPWWNAIASTRVRLSRETMLLVIAQMSLEWYGTRDRVFHMSLVGERVFLDVSMCSWTLCKTRNFLKCE